MILRCDKAAFGIHELTGLIVSSVSVFHFEGLCTAGQGQLRGARRNAMIWNSMSMPSSTCSISSFAMVSLFSFDFFYIPRLDRVDKFNNAPKHSPADVRGKCRKWVWRFHLSLSWWDLWWFDGRVEDFRVRWRRRRRRLDPNRRTSEEDDPTEPPSRKRHVTPGNGSEFVMEEEIITTIAFVKMCAY